MTLDAGHVWSISPWVWMRIFCETKNKIYRKSIYLADARPLQESSLAADVVAIACIIRSSGNTA